MKGNRNERGALLLEVIVAGSFLAIATLGLSAAMVSGVSLEENSRRTLSGVATAENLLEQIRTTSQTDFAKVVSDFNGTTKSSQSSVGFEQDPRRTVRVDIPLNEASVPGYVDLDGNGTVSSLVNPADARVLVMDVSGANGLRLRSAVPDFRKLTGVVLQRESVGPGSVVFGEVRCPLPPPPPPPEPPPPGQESPVTVSVASASIAGKAAQLVLVNNGTADRRPVSITIAPDKDTLYFKKITLDKTTIFTPPTNQQPGTVTVEISSTETFAPGEATLKIGDFYVLDKKGKQVGTAPTEVAVTISYDDGSVTSTVVK